MSLCNAALAFTYSGTVQNYVVPSTGSYVIEAAGAQGGSGGGPGGKGARLKGVFDLNEGDCLQIVVGQQGIPGSSIHLAAGGGGGGSFVWLGMSNDKRRAQLLLAAGGGGGGAGGEGVISADAGDAAVRGGRNGHGGSADVTNFHFSGGGGAGWLSGGGNGSSPTYCFGGTHWRGGGGANYCGNLGGGGGFGGGGGGAFLGYGSGGGGGYSGGGGGTQTGAGGGGGGSFNIGRQQENTPGTQLGHGSVWVLAVSARLGSRELVGDGAGYMDAKATSLLVAARLSFESSWDLHPGAAVSAVTGMAARVL